MASRDFDRLRYIQRTKQLLIIDRRRAAILHATVLTGICDIVPIGRAGFHNIILILISVFIVLGQIINRQRPIAMIVRCNRVSIHFLLICVNRAIGLLTGRF